MIFRSGRCFVEYGRLPKADKYDDGTYDADILMVKAME